MREQSPDLFHQEQEQYNDMTNPDNVIVNYTHANESLQKNSQLLYTISNPNESGFDTLISYQIDNSMFETNYLNTQQQQQISESCANFNTSSLIDFQRPSTSETPTMKEKRKNTDSFSLTEHAKKICTPAQTSMIEQIPVKNHIYLREILNTLDEDENDEIFSIRNNFENNIIDIKEMYKNIEVQIEQIMSSSIPKEDKTKYAANLTTKLFNLLGQME